jgi:hypothetical protein
MGSVESSSVGKGMQELLSQASTKGEISGYKKFPCNGVYNMPNDM